MHLPDGVLPAPVAIAGYGATGLMTWYSLHKINQLPNPQAQVPKASLLTAAFFVASWVHVPVPPTSVHLILNGLLGTVLGYYAFPAILIGLFFQAIMFNHGGLSTLGVNAIMMGIPAVLAYHIFQLRHLFGRDNRALLAIFSFLAGGLGLGMATAVFFTLLMTSLPATLDTALERQAIYGLTIAHVPLMAIEGFFTALLVLFFYQVKPELLEAK
jgi:cobalt/nickel transport system permease protein